MVTILPDCRPTFKLPGLIHGGWAHAASSSFGFRVASKRLGNYGSQHSSGSANGIFFLVVPTLAGRRMLLRRPP